MVLAHDRRRILSVTVTTSPSAAWTANQIVQTFPWETAPRYLLRDRDGIYGAEKAAIDNLKAAKIPTCIASGNADS